VPPAFAPDGLPYFAFRWSYAKVSKQIKKVTGIDHISIDFNSCGHPPLEIFGVPHYDLHIYLEKPKFRTCMTCDKIPDTPICDFRPDMQTTASGLGKLKVKGRGGLLERIHSIAMVEIVAISNKTKPSPHIASYCPLLKYCLIY
jgi:hypothetical protein